MALAGTSQNVRAWPPLCAAAPILTFTAADTEDDGSAAEIARPTMSFHDSSKSVQASSGHGAVDAAAQEIMSLLGM